ncbi:DUF4240 domain-containing protein [Dactylosporangium sp. CS-033363]|uniref:DUF4240 domain-containing protein n=1 Tax=Dactylosporangium sp. CS-033363 TaxID=3239935 RepID=UPI003D8D79B3
MDEQRFWQLIDMAGGSVDGLDRLRAGLEGLKPKDVVRFQERLARVLYDLDREVLAGQPVRFDYDDEDDEDPPLPLSDDSFLYLRCGLVLRGRDTVAAVLADPAMLATGRWPDAEALLYLADEVVGDDIETKYDFETGSNEAHWSEPDEEPREAWDTGPRPVVVTCEDRTKPLDFTRIHEDGTETPGRSYGLVRFLSRETEFGLTLDMSRAVALSGGLPGDLGTEHLHVTIGCGLEWQTVPEVVGLVEDEIVHGPVLLVLAELPIATARGWSPVERRTGLTALAAACVLAALPTGHGARPTLEPLHAAGAHLLRAAP